jgi:hypothetical protein
MDVVNHILGHEQGCPAALAEASSGGQAQKIASTLGVPGWAEGNSTCGSGFHGIFMFFVHLNVGTKFQLTIFIAVNLEPDDDFSWVQDI